jgi:hypothetical protein
MPMVQASAVAGRIRSGWRGGRRGLQPVGRIYRRWQSNPGGYSPTLPSCRGQEEAATSVFSGGVAKAPGR